MPESPPELLHATRWLKLLRRGHYVYASRRGPGEAPRLDAVNIVAWHVGPNGDRRLVVVHEYRPVIAGWQLALPAGLIDPGESPEAAAIRELREETGLEGQDIVSVTKMPLTTSAGMSDETIAFVTMTCRGVLADRPGVGQEKIRPMLVGQAQARDMLADTSGEEQVICARLWPILFSLAARGSFPLTLDDARTGDGIMARLSDWLRASDATLRLRCGEMTAQEIRTVRAVLRAVTEGNVKAP